MKILVIGSGLMGPAAAYNALLDKDVKRVTLADANARALAAAQARLNRLCPGDKLHTAVLDLADQEAATALIAAHDVVVAALPSLIIPLGIRAAAAAGRPWVDLTWPTNEELPALLDRWRQLPEGTAQ